MRSYLLILLSACSASPSSDVFPESTTQVAISVAGGLTPTPAAGSTCQPGTSEYTYAIATRHLAWTSCTDPNNDLVFTEVPGNTILSPADADQLLDRLRALELPLQCDADFEERFAFVTPNGTKSYAQAVCMPGSGDVMDLIYANAQ